MEVIGCDQHDASLSLYLDTEEERSTITTGPLASIRIAPGLFNAMLKNAHALGESIHILTEFCPESRHACTS